MPRQLSSQAQAAKQIRAHLKAQGIKASVTSESFAGGDAVRVEVENLNPQTMAEVNAFCEQYQYGHFDGSTDMYEYSNRDSDIPQTKFISVSNNITADVKQLAWENVQANYAEAAELPAAYTDVDNNTKIAGQWVDQFMWRFMNGDESAAFWATQKPAKAMKVKPKRQASINAVDSVTVRDGTRKGYSEIVFPEKPSDEARAELKAASYRWSPRNGVWWGKSDNLPAAYK